MRLSNETGAEAASRNVGRLALSLIPAALGGAAVLWLLAATGCIDLSRQRRVERRMMDSVGISVAPTAPITATNHDSACLKIESSFMDGRTLVFYARNTCSYWLSLPNFSFRALAHDGTTIQSARFAFNGDMAIAPSERREQRVRLGDDDRTERVELYVIDGTP